MQLIYIFNNLLMVMYICAAQKANRKEIVRVKKRINLSYTHSKNHQQTSDIQYLAEKEIFLAKTFIDNRQIMYYNRIVPTFFYGKKG